MFLTEPEPPRGVAQVVQPGIRRVVAANTGPMTYWGTNTYLLDGPDGVTVLDPGPDDPAHVAAVLATAGRIARIVLSHTHHDHLGATAALRAATGAPVHAWHDPADPSLVPDVPLHDGDGVGGWTAVHTPGHASDHLCFAGPDGVLLSADHVMSWSSSVVSPPGGSMTAYFASLRRLLARGEAVYLPGHGPTHRDALPFVQNLLDHRLAREAAILDALGPTPRSSRAITEVLYANVDPRLRRAAERNVIAHLAKLVEDGLVQQDGDGWVRV